MIISHGKPKHRIDWTIPTTVWSKVVIASLNKGGWGILLFRAHIKMAANLTAQNVICPMLKIYLDVWST